MKKFLQKLINFFSQSSKNLMNVLRSKNFLVHPEEVVMLTFFFLYDTKLYIFVYCKYMVKVDYKTKLDHFITFISLILVFIVLFRYLTVRVLLKIQEKLILFRNTLTESFSVESCFKLNEKYLYFLNIHLFYRTFSNIILIMRLLWRYFTWGKKKKSFVKKRRSGIL